MPINTKQNQLDNPSTTNRSKGNTRFDLTIIVVSDFEPGEKTWRDEVAMAKALSEQDSDISIDVVFVECIRNANNPPPDALFAHLPQARVVHADSDQSARLKDHGVAGCTTEWVAVFEADAVPERDWLSRLWQHAKQSPDHAVVGGRTHYGQESAWQRALNLLDRSFDDPGHNGDSVYISNNAAIYRTDVLRQFPYPDAATPFLSSRQRNREILRAGHKCFVDRDALSRHAIGGAGFVWDVRKHTGYSSYRLHEGRSWLDILRLTASRCKFDLANARRVGGRYLKPLDWAIWLPLFVLARIPEMAGMVEAKRGESRFRGSAYR